MNPPTHMLLEPKDRPFWDAITAEIPFGQIEWSEHQLSLAASLARTMANLEEAQRKCRQEGFVVTTERGRPIANPMANVVRTLTAEVLATRRALALHPGAQGAGNQKAGRRRALALEVERQAHGEGDDLIAKPARS